MPPADTDRILGKALAITHPSLALTKYWGKTDGRRNIPATPSLALCLSELNCKTEVEIISTHEDSSISDQVFIGGKLQNPDRFEEFFSELRELTGRAGKKFAVQAQSELNFPLAAGIASSSAGFAALALACNQALSLGLNSREISSLARIGSASAARSVFGGFTLLPAGGESAHEVAGHWPDLRVIVVETEPGPKKISSREAMEQCRLSSPFYSEWVRNAPILTEKAIEALNSCSLERLGPIIRRSYMRMFSTMFAAEVPIRYWSPRSLQVLDLVDKLRQEHYQFWETMDAGPQVKIFCEKQNAQFLIKQIAENVHGVRTRECSAAREPQVQTL